MPQGDIKSLHHRVSCNINSPGQYLHAFQSSCLLTALLQGSSLSVSPSKLDSLSVLIATRDQLTAALSLIELDGLARRLVLCPPDLSSEYLPAVIRDAEIEAIVTDGTNEIEAPQIPLHVICTPTIRATGRVQNVCKESEWLLFTSGTAGPPKMVKHSLAGLTAAIIAKRVPESSDDVWGTFYDIRRYGGLQIFLRAIFGGASLVLSDALEPPGDHLIRLAARAATHISGTPSHWRRTLMSPEAGAISPRYVRLSGEVADQALLDNLRTTYRNARIVHAYASTEAGVGFEVVDGREGFPISVVKDTNNIQFKIEDGSLRIRSPGAARCYVGTNVAPLAEADGFIDTGDIVERRGDRYYFLGRRNGVINVAGQKVHPEEVETIINRHPGVRMARVLQRRSSITGSVVVADVVLRRDCTDDPATTKQLSDEILRLCHGSLAPYKVPAMVRFVDAVPVGNSGKIARHRGQ